MKSKRLFIMASVVSVLLISSFAFKDEPCSIRVEVSGLKNAKGVVQFALYNREGSIPDENYRNYFKMQKAEIVDGVSSTTFKNIPRGQYAVNVLHDENSNGKIDKGLVLPKEGIGFSNYQSIGLVNRPNFSKARFEVRGNQTIKVKVIYM